MLKFEGLTKDFRDADRRRQCVVRSADRPDAGDHRPLRRRQVDAAAHDQSAHRADRRARSVSDGRDVTALKGRAASPLAARMRDDLPAVQPGAAPRCPHQRPDGPAQLSADGALAAQAVHARGARARGHHAGTGRDGAVDPAARRQLSGGQQQRVAIARALVQEPKILLADEPIASLDPRSAARVMDILRSINREDGITVICNLHTIDTARAYCDRIIGMRTGQVIFDGHAEARSTTSRSRNLRRGRQRRRDRREHHVDRSLPAATAPSIRPRVRNEASNRISTLRPREGRRP